ncbi:MAG TPA: DUF695 domain-containing protein [Bacillota bacterium]|nr:DUF695 domain-containing protein [Bacillota bacterium]
MSAAHSTKDEWLVGEGEYEGHRLLVRRNVGAEPMAGNARYPFKVGIAIPFLAPQKDGMPGKDELQLFGRIEDLVYDFFDAKRRGILCLVIITRGMREFVIYSQIDDITELIDALAGHFPAYDFQHIIEQDEHWDEYMRWAA